MCGLISVHVQLNVVMVQKEDATNVDGLAVVQRVDVRAVQLAIVVNVALVIVSMHWKW